MKFGLVFELSVPRLLTRAHEQLVAANTLKQARVADALGFDTAWVAPGARAGQSGRREPMGSAMIVVRHG